MAISAEVYGRVVGQVQDTVRFDDLGRRDWRRQTDNVKDVFIAARMFADLGARAVTVDGRMSDDMIRRAHEVILAGKSLTSFFNGRCHDAGITGRRLVVYDSKTGTKMPDRRGNSWARLHFHAIFEVDEATDEAFARLKKKLRRVFGHAVKIERYQLRVKPFVSAEGQKVLYHSLNGIRAYGPMGKVFYALDHAGSSYAALGLNKEGKRSRSIPWQGRANRGGKRLAAAIPSNFNSEVVFYDRESGQLGREAFREWVRANRENEKLKVGEGKSRRIRPEKVTKRIGPAADPANDVAIPKAPGRSRA